MPSITDTQAGGRTEEQVGKGLELFGGRGGSVQEALGTSKE